MQSPLSTIMCLWPRRKRSLGAEEPEYNNKAYSFPCTYQDGHLQLYSTHPTKPLTFGGRAEGHCVPQHPRFGKDGARQLHQMPAPSPTTTFTDSRTSRSTVVVAESDTYEDELARNKATPVKRRRPSAASSVSYDSATGRDSRTASFETPNGY